MTWVSWRRWLLARQIFNCALRSRRRSSTIANTVSGSPDECLLLGGVQYRRDDVTNVRDSIARLVGRNLLLQQGHPLQLLKQRIANYMRTRFRQNSPENSAEFSLYDQLSPVVSIQQNFDSLLVPEDHVSRRRSDNYYINSECMLRSHTSAHQTQLLQAGCRSFLVAGDVYRRDEIDRTHFPVFHQMEGLRVMSRDQLFGRSDDQLFRPFTASGQDQICPPDIQPEHTTAAATLVERDLKSCLEGLVIDLFGDAPYRWVSCQFPFTQPSWELEVQLDGRWMETLGCGLVRHKILVNSGMGNHIGWAFGLGLERLAMKLYTIPDIRLFWSRDTGFLAQFSHLEPNDSCVYKPISKWPQCANDLSFWMSDQCHVEANDFYDLVRSVAGDVVEQVRLIDEFQHPQTARRSQCYRITYRHMERNLTQAEVNRVHANISAEVVRLFHVEIR